MGPPTTGIKCLARRGAYLFGSYSRCEPGLPARRQFFHGEADGFSKLHRTEQGPARLLAKPEQDSRDLSAACKTKKYSRGVQRVEMIAAWPAGLTGWPMAGEGWLS